MMIGDVMDSDARLQQNLQEPQASLDSIVSALNQSRATMADHASGLARGFSSNGPHHNKLKRASYGKIGGNQPLGFVAVAEGNQEQAGWVSGCRGIEGSGETLARVSQKGVPASAKEMGSFSIGGSREFLGISGGAMEISGNFDGKRSCINAGAKMVYDKAVKCSLKIQVIDETGLLETVSVPKSGNGRGKEMGSANEALDEKKAKQSRGKGKGARKAFDSKRRQKNEIHMGKAQRNGAVSKRMYSRKEMEALRFLQVLEQQKMWKKIHIGFGPCVAREYDDLAIARHQKQVPKFDPRLQRYGKNPSPGILGVATRGR